MPKLIVFSGAGLSAESGLATFRGSPAGLWENHDINKVCNYLTWKQNFDLVHSFYNMRREQLSRVAPNSAHRQIAAWQQRYDTVILTQNVDDLLERAGCTNVIHLHGFLPEITCEHCGHVWNVGYRALAADERCPKCASHKAVKPAVVFFNQDAPRYHDLHRTMAHLTDEDVVLVIGTSGNVIEMGDHLHDRPGYKIFNALEAPACIVYDEELLMPATQALPLIDNLLKQRWA